MTAFVHLHVHSEYSLLDGAIRIPELVSAAKERGNPAIAITDHGTLRGFYSLAVECTKADVKPIFGIELYVCPDMRKRKVSDADLPQDIDLLYSLDGGRKIEDEQAVQRKLTHLTVWAMDNKGLANLYRLASAAWLEGFYYRPRIDFAELAKYSDGLLAATGCFGSVVNSPWVNGNPRMAEAALGTLDEIFGDRLYLEIMPHSVEEQKKANVFALDVRRVDRHKLLATQDAHYLRADDFGHHEVLLAIGSHKPLGAEGCLRFTGNEYWLKTRDEMKRSFALYHPYISDAMVEEALDSTVELASRCTASISINPLRGLMPSITLPIGYDNEFSYLMALVSEGMTERNLAHQIDQAAAKEGVTTQSIWDRYTARIKNELKVLKKSGFASYFLVIHELCRWAKAVGIAKGPGRGSAAGSIVAYLLGITDVDPVEHCLMFERFIAPGRVNYPDCDLDFDDSRREEVVEHLQELYGVSSVAQISTMGSMAGKLALRDVGRAYDVPTAATATAAAFILPHQENDEQTILKTLESSPDLRNFRDEYPEVISHAVALEGLTKSVGVHPAGVVISPVPLVEIVPLETRGKDHDQVVTAFDMRGVEGVGLLKIDILGLKNVSVLARAKKQIGITLGKDFNWEDVPLDDQLTLQGFSSRDFRGIFQFDTASAYSACFGLEFQTFDDIAAINAINRPGALAFADEFKARRKDSAALERHFFHPKVTAITADALGLMVYQEHVIRVAREVAGFSASRADELRKKIGKKEGAISLELDRQEFIDGCKATTPDMAGEVANRLFDQIVKFGRYGFNRSHAVCYSLIAYYCMYAKRHYPLEFYWALLSSEGDTEKLQAYSRDARAHGIQVLLPHINYSESELLIDREARGLRGSLGDIKGLGAKAVSHILSVRREGPFLDAVDFIRRAHGKAVTRKVIEALGKSGALDDLVPNTRWFIRSIDKVVEGVSRSKDAKIRHELDISARLSKWTTDERLRTAAEVTPLAQPPHPAVEWHPWIVNNVSVPLTEVGDEAMAFERTIYFVGLIDDVETRAVGDSRPADEIPDEETCAAIGWGKRWMKLALTVPSGDPVKARVEWTLLEDIDPILDRGRRLVLICGKTRPAWRMIDVNFMADVVEIDRKLVAGEPLGIWERLFILGRHPCESYRWPTKAERRLAIADIHSVATRNPDGFFAIGVANRIHVRPDRNGQSMAFFGVAGLRSYLDVVCFADPWSGYSEYLKPGVLAKYRLSNYSNGFARLGSGRAALTIYGGSDARDI